MTTGTRIALNSGKDGPDAKRSGFSWLATLRIILLLWALVCVEQDIEVLMQNAGVTPNLGSLGLSSSWTPSSPPGFSSVVNLRPDAPAARAGITVGDHLRFDRSYDYERRLRVGERVGVTVDHAGQRRHVVLTAAPASPPTSVWSVVTYDNGNALSCLIMVLFGGFFVWRGGRKATTLLLGAGLISYGLASAWPQLLLSAPGIFPFAFAIASVNFALIPLLFWGFALAFYAETIAPPKPWAYVLFGVYAVIQFVVEAGFSWFLFTLQPLPLIGSGFDVSTWLTYFGFIVAFVYLFAGWRRSRREAQQRYALMLVATAAIILAQVALSAVYFLTILPVSFKTPMSIASAALGGIVAPPLFTYAILRHKVLDLGFAINRTLVYGVVSTVLLVIFGVAEWAFEHFLPVASREASVFVDAGIALAVFLIFHRVRDFVEHHVEKLFFHKWHEKEAHLKRFVREATFILKRDAMINAYVEAMRAFCEGADVALYVPDETGVFRLAQGGLADHPAVLDADDSLMVTLRADRMPFEPDNHETAIALALPMIHRNDFIGVTLLGAKLSGFGYRPDEKEVLAHAAQQIGLDLHALEVERLQQANYQLVAAHSMLTAKYEALRDITDTFLKTKA